MSKYKWFLRQEIRTREDMPTQAVFFHLPRGPEGTEPDYTVILKYDLVWWPEKEQRLNRSYLLARYEADGSA